MAVRATARNDRWLAGPKQTSPVEIHAEEQFLRRLYVEQKRIERVSRRFVLMLAEPSRNATTEVREEFFAKLIPCLSTKIRETDIVGWYAEGRVIGTIFTEIDAVEVQAAATALQARFTSITAVDKANPTRLHFHVFPDDWTGPQAAGKRPIHDLLDSAQEGRRSAFTTLIKRVIDIVGSSFALVCGAPLLGLIALAVKITSPGPVLFRQQRVGQSGREFTFLKFRSMTAASDTSIHEEYTKAFISGTGGTGEKPAGTAKVFKLVSDPRVTPIGRFLRRTSLDELPQFYNVLKGDMSLVGPRPPIPYEVNRYRLWHKRRFLSVKPGLTGLWQVQGRSRTTFDEMVRLDLQYAQTWSIWVDLKLLILTPFAVVRGDGAC